MPQFSNKPRWITVHCTAASHQTAPQQFFAVNRYHKDRGFPLSSLGYYGGYHILIERDGTELRYREDWEIGAHCNDIQDGLSMNMQSLGVCLAGNFDIEFPTPAQIETLRKRLVKWTQGYPEISYAKILPHRNWSKLKTCYGANLASDWARKLVAGQPKDWEEDKKRARIQELFRQLDFLKELLLKLKIRMGVAARQKSPPVV